MEYVDISDEAAARDVIFSGGPHMVYCCNDKTEGQPVPKLITDIAKLLQKHPETEDVKVLDLEFPQHYRHMGLRRVCRFGPLEKVSDCRKGATLGCQVQRPRGQVVCRPGAVDIANRIISEWAEDVVGGCFAESLTPSQVNDVFSCLRGLMHR